MFFPVKENKFSGLLRSFSSRGYPKIELLPSSSATTHPSKNVLNFENNISHWVSGNEGLNAHFDVKIVSGVLRITNYTIRSHYGSDCYMRAWTFEASNDNFSYTMLDNRPQNDDLNCSGVVQYHVNQENNYYQYFRIRQTVKTIADSTMRLSGIDFYGEFLPFRTKTCKCSKNQHSLLALINILILS